MLQEVVALARGRGGSVLILGEAGIGKSWLGATNRRIATTLFISEKTASVHVSRILTKLGVTSRHAAAAAGRRRT